MLQNSLRLVWLRSDCKAPNDQGQRRRTRVSAPHRPGHVVTSDMVRFAACFLALPLATALWAQPPASYSSKPPSHAKSPFPEASAISAGVYHNSTFGFSCKVPYGWVDRTADMQDDSADASKSRLLLAVFERPPEATGDTINSAVVIAAEALPAGMKTAAEYFESLSGAWNACHASGLAGDSGERLRNFLYVHWRERRRSQRTDRETKFRVAKTSALSALSS